jgi:membrane fusion protein (multidrug efflux system)
MLRLILLCLLLLLTACRSQEQKPKGPFAGPPAVDVTDFIVREENIPAVYNFIGFAESSHPVEIRARVEGFLDKIAYEEGQVVHEGDLLFQLDPKQYQARVEQAKGEVARAKAQLENAILTVNRLKPLYEQKAASKKDLDNAIAAQLSNEAALMTAEANLLESQINLGYTVIRSPITGLIDKSRYREGALISPGPNGLLTTVSVMDPIWVTFSISDNDILQVREETSNKQIVLPKEDEWVVEAILSDDTLFPFEGMVNFSSPTYDQSTSTIQVRAVFPNPTDHPKSSAILRPGQFVRIKLYGADRPNAIAVPQEALSQKKGGMFVYRINSEGKVESQDVSTSDWYGDYQIITNGLKAGDQIVVQGINKVRPGSLVKVVGHWQPTDKKKQNLH